jgi:hypothetical protein
MAYVDVSELQRVLQKGTPTAAELVAMQRVVDEGAREIDWELLWDPASNPVPVAGTPEYAILTEVNLSRAVELWNMEFRPFGQIPAGGDGLTMLSARDSWARQAIRLLPLKQQFGVS